MIRAALLLLALWAVASCGDHRAGPAAPAPDPAVWAIRDADGQPVGWLFGTIHSLPEGTAWETPLLTRIIAHSHRLVVETSDLEPRRVASTLQRLASDSPGPALAERVPPSQRARLLALMERADLAPGALDGLETWAAALSLSRASGSASQGGPGVDQTLITRFAGRPVAALEGTEAQLAIFDRLAESDQRSLLAAVIAESEDAAKDGHALAAAWLTGDLAQIEARTLRGMLSDPELRQALLLDRNRAWAERLPPLLTPARPALVAVGAAHVVGPDGLPALLVRRGYRLRRIE